MPYISDDAVFEQQKRARILTQKLNTIDRSDFDLIREIVKELLGKSENAFINPPFYCDYGFRIEVGKNFFANYNCTILDAAKVIIHLYRGASGSSGLQKKYVRIWNRCDDRRQLLDRRKYGNLSGRAHRR